MRPGCAFKLAERSDPVTDLNQKQMAGVGPANYKPNIDAVLKTGTSKQMLGRSMVTERRIDPNEPGPGHYTLPDAFLLKEVKPPTGPTETRKKPIDDSKITFNKT